LFVERKRQWRPRVADMVSADGLLPVQVSECHVVRAGEEVDRHGLDTADEAAQGAFATAGIAATHKGVRGHAPSCTVPYVGARRGELDAEDILGALDVWVGEGFACGELVAEGDGGDGDGTVRILKDKRPLGCREWATHEGATRIGQCSPGADAVTRIV